jgi:hypothetical protein
MYGTPIEVAGERAESSQTFARPDGTFTMRQSATPRRVRRSTGWVPVDTTLERGADAVTPVATTLDMRFSAGGTGPLLSFGKGSQRVSLSWPTALPVPALSGATATYAEVLPGVDLLLTANADSFGEVLVVKNAEAAENEALRQLQFGITGTGVTLRQGPDKVIQAVDAAGSPVFVSDGAAMWQAPAVSSAASARSAAAPVAEPAPVSIPVTLAAQTLTVTPSRDLLTGTGTRFPLYIDPGFNGVKEIWTVVSRLHPDTSYWTDDNWRDTMRVGQNWQSSASDDWRTIVQFNTTRIAHSQILSASVLTNVWHSADCTPSPLTLYKTLHISPSNAVTWNNTVSTTSTPKWWPLRTVKATANKHECPKGNDQVEFGDPPKGPFNVRGEFQKVADAGNATMTLAFRAPDEADGYQWKKLVKDSTELDVNYNHPPGKAVGLGVSPCDRNPCASPAKTNSKYVKLKMAASDPDGGTLRYEFVVYDSARKVLKAKSYKTVTGVKSGSSQPWTVVGTNPKGPLPDGVYQWKTYACDTYSCGDPSDWYSLTVDTTNPGAPDVDIKPYLRMDAKEAEGVPSGFGGPGIDGALTLKPFNTQAVDQVSSYVWWFTTGDTTAHRVVADSAGVGRDTVTPAREGANTIKAYAVDTAGNRTQSEAEYRFKVSPAGGQWVWDMDDGGKDAQAASSRINNRAAKVQGTGLTWTDRNEGYTLSLDGRGNLRTDLPVLDTKAAAGFTVAAWVKLAPDVEVPPPPADPAVRSVARVDLVAEPTDPPPGAGDEDYTPLPSVMDNTMTVLSQDGVHTSMFRLGYRPDVDTNGDGKPDPAWCFTLKNADDVLAATTSACSSAYLVQDEWVHLVGVADRKNNSIRLYVNGGPGLRHGADFGVRVEEAGAAATWASTGGFVIGRGLAETGIENWHGEIDDVHAVPAVWPDSKIEQTAAVAGEEPSEGN